MKPWMSWNDCNGGATEKPLKNATTEILALPFFSAGTIGLEQTHANFVGDLVELFVADLFQRLAAMFQVLVHLDGLFLHYAMCLFAAAHELEVLAGRDAGVAILVVKPKAQQPGFLSLFALASHLRQNLPDRRSICNGALLLAEMDADSKSRAVAALVRSADP
jgi:hypothetical protein